jgi:hypothetical protein
VSWDTTGKNLTRAEAQSLTAAGIAVVVNWSYDEHEALSGYNKGVESATEAQRQALACGMPADRPIYISIDFDARPSQQTAINSYFDGVAAVIGRNRVGAFGGYHLIGRLFDAGKITWGWQTYAWSNGRWDARAHLRQVQDAIVVGGGQSDLDQAVSPDFGQWGTVTPASGRIMSSPTVLGLPDATIALYATASDGNVWGTRQTAPGGPLPAWQRIGASVGTFVGRPAVLPLSHGRIALAVRTIDGRLMVANQTAAGTVDAWSYAGTGGGVVSDPTTLSRTGGGMNAYVTANDGNVWYNDQAVPGGSWGSWRRLTSDGTFVGTPSAVPTSAGGVALFVRTGDGRIATASQPAAGATLRTWAYVAVGGGLRSHPRITRLGGEATVVHCTATDGNVWTTLQTSAGAAWHGWRQVAPVGGLVGDPIALVLPNGAMALFARTTGGRVMGTVQRTALGPYDAWSDIADGRDIVTDPQAVMASDGMVALYVTADDGHVWGTNQTGPGGGWAGWRRL